jgi:glycosyltransferase involved in cell wall biosynthesis
MIAHGQQDGDALPPVEPAVQVVAPSRPLLDERGRIDDYPPELEVQGTAHPDVTQAHHAVAISRQLKILLTVHGCSPYRGSEPGVAWNWAWHLSALHQVWVLAHPRFRQDVEQFVAERPNPNLRFVWTSDPWFDPWNPLRGEWGIRLHYLLWRRQVLRLVIKLHRLHHFDVAHHVGWCTISAPPLLWRLPIPFVWGPVGGGQTTPASFRAYLGRSWPADALRTLRVRLLLFLPAFRQAVQRSALVLAANQETARILEAARARQVRLLADAGVVPGGLPPTRRARGDVILLWAGRLEPIKALPLALEALARTRNLPVQLLVAGEGPRRQTWERLAVRLGLQERVMFLGTVPWERMPELYSQADVLLFTSLRDTFGTVVFEAMAHALPILALAHQGVELFVPPTAGIKVPVTTPAETVEALADGIRHLVHHPERRLRMGEAAWAYAKTQTWDRRAETMSAWYEECLDATRDRASHQPGSDRDLVERTGG